MIILFFFSSIMLLYNSRKIKDDYLNPLFGGLFLLYLYGVGGVGITYFVEEEYLQEYLKNEIFIASIYGFLCMALYWAGFSVAELISQNKDSIKTSIILNRGSIPLAYTFLLIGFSFGILAMIYFSGSISSFLAHTDERQSNSVGKTWILFFLMAVKWGFFILISRQEKQSLLNNKFLISCIGLAVFGLLMIWGRLFVMVFLVQLIVFFVATRRLSLKKFILGAVSIFLVIFVAGVQRWMQGAAETKDIVKVSDSIEFAINNIDYKYLLLHNFFDGWYVYLGFIATSIRQDWNSFGAITFGSVLKVIPGMYGNFGEIFLTGTARALGSTYDTGLRASNFMGEAFLDFNFFGIFLFFVIGFIVSILYRRERLEKQHSAELHGTRFWSFFYIIVFANFAIAVRTGTAAGFTWLFADICWLLIWVFFLAKKA